MPELTREEKLKLVEKLPQQLQDFLYSEDTGAFLLYLGQKYNLPDEKVRLLSKLVADVVLGIVPITSLAQEINSKITFDIQAAMHLAQELNIELLAPVMTPMPSAPVMPAPATEMASPTPTTVPEIIDLRKTPPISTPAPAPTPPAPKPLTSPLTFTRPVEPAKQVAPATLVAPAMPIPQPPLIEAEPHQKPAEPHQKPIDAYREPRPQYIMRPSGAPPTDSPENVLDLRKDKGEF
jgi:hypothetical protein